MLILASRLLNIPIMGLQTGAKLAQTKRPIIDPSNLRIIAYEVDGPFLDQRPSLLLVADVRELSNIGMIIDSNDEFISTEDVISVNKIYELDFKLIGFNVVDDRKRRLGKVSNYTIDTGSFVIQQLNVKQGVIKSLTETELLIHRTQIIEINNDEIIVRSASKEVKAKLDTQNLGYINPFRTASNPQAEATETDSI